MVGFGREGTGCRELRIVERSRVDGWRPKQWSGEVEGREGRVKGGM